MARAGRAKQPGARFKVEFRCGAQYFDLPTQSFKTQQAMRSPIPFSRRALTYHTVFAALLALSASHALASEPQDRVICTTEPQSSWMSEAEACKRFHAEKYLLVRFKISTENCHEFYAVEHDGNAVEAYVHPITGEVVRSTRIRLPKQTMPKAAKP